MYRLFTIIRMEFLREFSSRSTLIFFLILPLVFTATIGGQLGDSSTAENGGETAVEVILFSVVDDDTGLLSDILLNALAANGLTVVNVDELGEGGGGLVIPATFSDRLIAGEGVSLTLAVDGNDSRTPVVQEAVAAAQIYLETAVLAMQAGADEAEARGMTDRDAFYRHFLNQLVDLDDSPQAGSQVTWAGDGARNSITDAEQASAGQMITWVLVTLLGTSAVLVNERLSGTFSRLSIMPTSGAIILSGKLLSRFLMGLMQMVLLFAGGALLFGVAWGNSPVALVLVSLAFALAITGLGLLLATLVKTGIQAGSINTGLAMALAALGGAWWPLEITPPLYQQVVLILPTTWAMQAYTKILLRSSSAAELWPEITALFAFATLFFLLGLWRFERSRLGGR